MQAPQAVAALSALAHDHRLAVFRLLVGTESDGLAAGDIARELALVPSTLSSHLAILERAGLVQSRRDGRSIIYSVDRDGMRALLGFLADDCCGGHPDMCAPPSAPTKTRRVPR